MERESKIIEAPLNISDTKIIVEVISTTPSELNKGEDNGSHIKYEDLFPGVYCFFNKDSIYIGESMSPFYRLNQHLNSGKLEHKDNIRVFISRQFHRSAIYDIETKLISYISADDRLELRNIDTSQGNYNYFLKNQYNEIFNKIWEFLKSEGLVYQEMKVLEKKDIYKFSPYKSLNFDQFVVTDFFNKKENFENSKITIIQGFAGTGKSIVASKIYYELSKKFNVCLTAGTHPIVDAFKKTFKRHNATLSKPNMSIVSKTSELKNNNTKFDLIIVDEAHKLVKSSSHFKGQSNKISHLRNKFNDEIEYLLSKTNELILIMDMNQQVGSADFSYDSLINLLKEKKLDKNLNEFYLKSQIRTEENESFVNFVYDFLEQREFKYEKTNNYDVKVFGKFSEMYLKLKQKRIIYSLTRIVSGYTVPWISNPKKCLKNKERPYDFNIDNIKLRWNSQANNWVFTKAAENLEEVAYYHTIQGFDLDYVGVIIGKDLYINEKGELDVDSNFVVAKNDKPLNNDPLYNEKLKQWVINRYKILLTRGVKGVYIYAEDERLSKKLMEIINNV